MTEQCDVVIWDTVGGPYGETLAETSSLGGCEYALVRKARALAERGYKVVAFGNRTDVEHADHGRGDVCYRPWQSAAMLAGGLETKALIHVRYSVIPPSQCVKVSRTKVCFLVDSGHPSGQHPERQYMNSIVFLSDWHAAQFPEDVRNVVIPGMLDDSIYEFAKTTKDPTRFVYVSAAMKGLEQTLKFWRHLKRAHPAQMKTALLHVATPAWSQPTESQRDEFSGYGVHFMDSLPTAEVPGFIADAAGLFYVNTFPETFCNLAAIAEAVGTRVHILCKNGLGGLRDAVNSSLVTTDEKEFEKEFLACLGAAPLGLDHRLHGTPKNLRVSHLIDRWIDVLGLERQPHPITSAGHWNRETSARRIRAREAELKKAYEAQHIPHSFWATHALTIDPETFRGHNQFLWQGPEYPYEAIVEHIQESAFGRDLLLYDLVEDGAFGCVTRQCTLKYGTAKRVSYGTAKRVSRDLLDSIVEILFLNAHVPGLPSLTVLDIGAGYGRLAHRLAEAFPNITVYCVDAVPIATAVCEEYIRFRNLENVHVIGLHELDALPPIDLAVNIHSWSECTLEGIRYWLNWLRNRNVPRLFLVPHDEGFQCNDGPRGWQPYGELLKERGFDLAHKTTSTFGRPDWSGQFYHYLFEVLRTASDDGVDKMPPRHETKAGDLAVLAEEIALATADERGTPARRHPELAHLLAVERRSQAFGGGMGTHLPVLCAAVATAGPGDVLELGAGDMSTPVLAEMCRAMGRRLFTIERDERWSAPLNASHEVRTSEQVDAPELFRRQWAVVFIDQSDPELRKLSLEAFGSRAELLVLHDSTCAYYGACEPLLAAFRYRRDYLDMVPATTVVSNQTPVIFDTPGSGDTWAAVANAPVFPYWNGHHANVSPVKVQAMRSTVCLTMIVKAGCEHLERALKSAKPWITTYVIVLDDETTDDTPGVIRKALQGLEGKIVHRPWQDFSTNRNAALDLAVGKADYVLVLDADDELEGSIPRLLTADCYEIEVKDVRSNYWRRHLFKPDVGMRYKGVRHETLDDSRPVSIERLPGLVYHRRGAGTTPEGYLKDAVALSVELEKHPGDARTAFYLAQSLADGGESEKAIEAYRKRATMGDFDEEVWYSHLQIGKLKEKLARPNEEVIEAYLAAADVRPTRAEALYEAARFANGQKLFAMGYAFARRAVMIPRPADRLFVDAEVYAWRATWELAVAASYLDKKAEARRLFEDLKGLTGPDQHPVIEANLAFC